MNETLPLRAKSTRRGIRKDFYESTLKDGLQKRPPVSALKGYAEAQRVPLRKKTLAETEFANSESCCGWH